MKKNKDVIKHINHTRKKNNYHWKKEGKEIIQKINSNKFDKNELKNILSILLLTEEIPIDFIPSLWLSSAKIQEKINNNIGQYQKYVKAFDILIKNKHPFYLFLQKKMSVDLNRSFNPNDVEATEEKINQLKNILNAFTVRNVSLNYCQGYNIIASFFLRMTNFKEEESFYLFCRLMEDILPYDYYLFGIGIEAETAVVNNLLEKYEPELMDNLAKKEGADLIIYGIITKFITSLFTFKIDQNITIFFFNIIFGFYSLEENKENIFYYFYKIILAIFKSFKADIIKCKDYKKLNDILNFDKINKEKMQCIIYYTLYDETLIIYSVAKIREETIKKIIQGKKIKFNYENDEGLECNINYPICLEESEVESKLYLNNYYQKGISKINTNNNIIINEENDDESILKDIIIERRPHYCQIKSLKKKYINYSWEKEGNEILNQISNNPNNFDKKKLKEILSILLFTQNINKDLIPNFWQTCTKLQEIINKNKGQYNKLLKAFDILIKNKHPFYIHIQKKIALDLNRTFSREKNLKENIDILKNILYAFTIRNISLNYCQGLNNIVRHLLKMMNFKEEETFYLFLILIEKILPHDYFLYGIGVEADLNIIKMLLDKYEPDLMAHIKKIKGDTVILGVYSQFTTSLLTYKINEDISNILFNLFFGFFLLEENSDNLFFYFYRLIIGIFRTFKEGLYRVKHLQDIYAAFDFDNEQSKDCIEKIIYYTLFETEPNFDLNEIKTIRQNEINKLLKIRKIIFDYKNEEKIKCNLIYPLCIEECKVHLPIELKVNYEKITTKENNDKNEIVINSEESDEEILKDITIERRKHFCQK